MTIALIIMIPITSLLTSLLVLKAYTKGLQHNYELKHDIKPTEPKTALETLRGYKDILKAEKAENKEEEQAKEQANIMSEWLNGKVEE